MLVYTIVVLCILCPLIIDTPKIVTFSLGKNVLRCDYYEWAHYTQYQNCVHKHFQLVKYRKCDYFGQGRISKIINKMSNSNTREYTVLTKPSLGNPLLLKIVTFPKIVTPFLASRKFDYYEWSQYLIIFSRETWTWTTKGRTW